MSKRTVAFFVTALLKNARSTAIALGLLGLSAGAASGQQRGEIAGRVTGPAGDPLANAAISVQDRDPAVVTDRAGRFHLVGIAPGSRQLIVRYLGLRTDTVAILVEPGRTMRLEISLELAPIALQGITVQGERGAQLGAINQQRSALGMINVVQGNEIGKLPEQNVAEAVQRVAGLSVRTSRGEGRFVSIRGTAPNLNNVTLNGQTLASTAESRATALDLLPAAMVSGIEVTKTVTPDMDGNAVGGTINIETLSAFDRDRPFVMATVAGMLHEQQVDYGDDKMPFRADITAGTRFGADDTWGIVVAGSASRRDFTASVLDPDGWQEVEGSILPEELELQVEDNERERYGFSGNLDWRPGPRTSLYLNGVATHTREVTANSEYEFGFEGELEMQTATIGRFTAGSAELDLSEDEEIESLYALTLGGEQLLGDGWTWQFAGTFTRGVLDRTGPDATFETASSDEVHLSSVVDVTPYFFTIDPDEPGFISDPTSYPLRSANWQVESNREDTWVASSDLRWDTRVAALPAFLQLGGKLQVRDKLIDDISHAYLPHGITLEPYALPATGTVQGGSEAFVHGNTDTFTRFFEANRGEPAFFELEEEETALNAVESDSDNLERIYAGYVMGSLDAGQLTLLAGARVEHTRTESRRYEFAENDETGQLAIADRSFENDYTSILPALILKLVATDHLVLRAGWTNTIGRPDYEELAGFRSVQFERTATPGVFEGSVQEGNPELEPYLSSNVDVSAEYYFPLGGLLSAGGFYKRIDNPIYEFDINRRDVEFEGRFYRELRMRQDRNADAGTLRGVELTYTQPLFFLPRPLDGLGITANAAVIDSEVRVPGREGDDLPFFGQSDRVFNVVPYYQRGPIELRLAWSYRSEYLDEVGEAPFEDKYRDDRATVDLSGRYTLLDGRLTVFGQARNLTNEPEVGFQGIPGRYDLHTLTGRTFSLGVSAHY